MMKRNRYFALLAILVIFQQVTTATAALKVAFYNNTACQNVEKTVRAEVQKRFQSDPSIAAQLLRIYFHDCFADGQCDASLLIKKNKNPSTLKPEILASTNLGIRGLDFIDFLKQQVVAACVGQANIVSCADIIALAARDAVALTAPNRRPYAIATGRLDGKVSNAANAETLPGSRQRIPDIISRFAKAGFSAQETLILSGAHTIGQSRCKFFDDRLYNWRGTRAPDPTLNTTTLAFLRKTCTNSVASKESRVFLDQNTSSSFVSDKSYFSMLTQHKGVLESDQKLLTDPSTKGFVKPLADGTEANFMNKFETAMKKLGNLGSTTVVGSKGDIRKVCSVLN
ncbi:hypothetical protein M758_11G081900 [Ceratodon purpureus]|uniref:Peroxidase n=1 Tax=Ceratodon purpureus TaxID=3225 RepID=A0A8T0GBU6_CERPU|nr:hypothetical protein KC19_11G085100 [Ceratodon purpureus]KAG0601073.1 hypothetical protein M758_11G081900 [Ceratodon purpureus]